MTYTKAEQMVLDDQRESWPAGASDDRILQHVRDAVLPELVNIKIALGHAYREVIMRDEPSLRQSDGTILPNTKVGNRIVIASKYFGGVTTDDVNLDLWSVILLAPHSPYFQCAHLDDKGIVSTGSHHHNIVDAVEDYEENW